MVNSTGRSMFFVNFPALVAIHHYEGEEVLCINQGLSDQIRRMEKEQDENARKTAAQGGFHTDPEFINRDDALITEFREKILIPGIQRYMAQYYQMMATSATAIQKEHLEFKGWGNIMRKGEWNKPHNHITLHNRLSAVYYLQIPDCPNSEGALQFDNPNQISMLHGAYGNTKVHPSEGDLVIFPCYQMHFSHPFNSDGERILIASDIRVKDQFDAIRNNNFNALNVRI